MSARPEVTQKNAFCEIKVIVILGLRKKFHVNPTENKRDIPI